MPMTTYVREVRDLPWSENHTTVVAELYRVPCPDCDIKAEEVTVVVVEGAVQRASRTRWGWSGAAGGTSISGVAASTVRTVDLLFEALGVRTEKAFVAMDGCPQIYLGKMQKFVTMVSNLESRGSHYVLARSKRKRRWMSFSSSS